MPPKRNKRPIKEKEDPIAGGAMADCVFPEEIMLCILTRLPVKSILRFKSVCKPWRELFHTPEFVKLHQGEFSSDPRNQSVFFYEANTSSMYVLNIIESTGKKKPTASKTILGSLYSETHSIHIVGCCNGLICLGTREYEQRIVLWNPALKLCKFIRASKVDFGDFEMVSLGFGYDADGDDFKVVRIVCGFDEEMGMDFTGAEVYSAASDSWTTIELGFQFFVYRPSCDLIVNGNLYWVASVKDKDEVEVGVLVCFDVRKMVFKIVPLPAFCLDSDVLAELVDWKGNVGAISRDDNDTRMYTFGVWVLDDGEAIWRKIHTFGPIQGSVPWFTCLKNGKLVGTRPNGKLIVFDPENLCVEEIVIIEESQKHIFKIYGYTESLIHVKGMIKEAEERVGTYVDLSVLTW